MSKNNFFVKRILPILLAVAMLFGISVVAIAAGGNGGGGGNAGLQANMAGTGFQLRLSNPDTTMANEGGTYELDGEFDASKDIVFTFSLNPQGGQKGFGIYPAVNEDPAGFNGVIIYDKDDSDKTPVLSLGGNYIEDTMDPNFFFEEINDAGYPDHFVFNLSTAEDAFSNERTSKLTIKANALENGKTYCLFFPKTIKTYNNGSPKQLGADVTIEFATADTVAEVVQSWVTGGCVATLYSDGLLVLEKSEDGNGETPNYKTSAPVPWLDYRGQIKRVEVKSGVTYVGNGAFRECVELTDAVLSDSVLSMGQSIFYNCSKLTNVKLPSDITELKKNIFNLCSNLEVIELPNSLAIIGDDVFINCDSLKSITLPASVTSIGWTAFASKNLKDVFINSDVESITIDKYAYGMNSYSCTFHVKCNQLDAFKDKNPDILNVEFEATHMNADPVKENEVSATCTEEGSYDEVVYCSVCKTELSREPKTTEALGHVEETVPGKEPTCTEKGLTEGTTCSRCHVTLKEQEEIPALGHDWEVIPEVISTCTEKGSTAGARCTRCGEYLIEPKEVPMIYHDYDEQGICKVCGQKDPNYVEPTKPEEPTTQKEEPTTQKEEPTTQKEEPTTQKQEEPTTKPATPAKKLNGLVKGPDGKWALYKEDSVQKSFTGLAKNENGWYYLKNGYVDWNYTGFAKNEKGWWRVKDGRVDFSANSIYKQPSNGVWYKTTNGFVTWGETGVFKNVNGWWRVENSRVNFQANGIYKNENGWWKTTGGKVHFNETGVFSNENGKWYVKNSKVDFSKNGKVTFEGKAYTVTNGYAKLS